MARPRTQTTVNIEVLSAMVDQLKAAGVPVPESVQAQLDSALESATLTKLARFSKSMKDDGNSNEVLNRYPTAVLNTVRTITKSFTADPSASVIPAPVKGYGVNWSSESAREYLDAITEWHNELASALNQLTNALNKSDALNPEADTAEADADKADAPKPRARVKA